jgi:hypothetical protein
MIIDNSNKVFETNMSPDKSMAFGISDVSLVMEVLSTLYKHSVRTLVQEYICNGRDAMREAGTWGKVPMKIGVPNNFERTFKVRDYGVGISPDRMANIFVNYGSSTKRNTNTQTGGFGIGAKSAFSYTDSFTVVSYYNKTKYTYLCYMTKEKGGCDLLSTEPTNEANGVEISVPVKPQSINEFAHAVQRCVEFWQEDIVFEGVTQGTIVQRKAISQLGRMSIYKSNYTGTVYLIDGIQYDLIISGSKWNGFRPETRDYAITINLPNGFFKLSPSRENIQDTLDNQEKEKVIIDECKGMISNKRKHINAQVNLADKIKERELFKGLCDIAYMTLTLDDNYTLKHDSLISESDFQIRYTRQKRRSNQFVIESGTTRSVKLNEVVLIKTNNETNLGNLSRRLNHYVDQHKRKIVISATDIPFEKELFDTIIQSETLPMPLAKPAVRQKATGESIAFERLDRGERRQVKMRDVNFDNRKAILFEEGMDVTLANWFSIYEIPKANKDALTKKLLTVKEANDILLTRKASALTASCPNFEKIKPLSHLKFPADYSLKNYLIKISPEFAKEVDDLKNLENELVKKYPLMEVLKWSTHNKNCTNILVNEINKQIKESEHELLNLN